MQGTAVDAAEQKTEQAERIPTLVEIIRKTGRLDNCLTTRLFHDNEKNLVETMVVAAVRFFRELPKAEADLLINGLQDGTALECLAERLQEEFIDKKK